MRFDALSVAILLQLHELPATAEQVARDLALPISEITVRLNRLVRAGLVVGPSNEATSPAGTFALSAVTLPRLAAAGRQDERLAAKGHLDPQVLQFRLEALRRQPLFGGLDETALTDLALQAVRIDVHGGEIVCLEGEEAQGVYVVVFGLIKLIKHLSALEPQASLMREQTIRLMAAGDSFNEVPVSDGRPNPVSAQAVADSQLLLIPRAPIVELMRQDPRFAERLVVDLAGRLRHMLAMVEDLSLRQVRSRVAKILLQSVDPMDGIGAGAEHQIRLTQREIADMAGTAREVVARCLREIERQGAISVQRGRVVILDQQKLRSIL